jgi:hypothetical protein
VGLGVAGFGAYLYQQRRPLAGASTGAAPELLSLLPRDAPAIGYIDLAALRRLENSPLAAVLGLTSAGPQADREYTEFVRASGFDYKRDLDQAAFAAWPQSLVPQAGGMGENPVLAIGEGRFNQERIKAYALRTGRVVRSGSQSVEEVPGSPPLSLTFLSSTRIALASGKKASELLAKLGTATAPEAGTQERIARVAGAPIFAVVRTDQLPASFYSGFGNSTQLERLARSVRGLTLAGQPDGEKIKIAVDAECDSMSNALELSTLLDFLRLGSSMALADPKTRRQMNQEQAAFLLAVVQRVKVGHQDKWVRLTLDVTPEMLGARTNAADPPPSVRPASPLAH